MKFLPHNRMASRISGKKFFLVLTQTMPPLSGVRVHQTADRASFGFHYAVLPLEFQRLINHDRYCRLFGKTRLAPLQKAYSRVKTIDSRRNQTLSLEPTKKPRR